MEKSKIHPDYQKYMDWAYWMAVYCQRSKSPFFAGINAQSSEKIMADILSGEALYMGFWLLDPLSVLPYAGVLIEPIFHRVYEGDESVRGKIRDILCQAFHTILDLKAEENEKGRQPDDISAHKIGVVGLDFEQPLNAIQEMIEILWLENNGFEEEVYLKRLALALGKKYNLSGPYVSRAAGLWLWDYLNQDQEPKPTQLQAIRAFTTKYNLEDIGLGKCDDTDLRFFLRRTNDCIEANEVLPFSKKGTASG
jgi:hypothetical protein